ncbi:MAG: cellulose binding domain-containing protein [Litoreibacter sp.]
MNVSSDTATLGFNVTNSWNSGFVANVQITAEQSLTGWTIEFEFDGNINSIWNAEIVSKVGNIYTITSKSYNANISEGASQSFGFVAAGDPDDVIPLSINGDSFGDDGNDTVVLSGNRDDYTVTLLGDMSIEISGPEGTNVYFDVTTFEFADITQTAQEVVLPRLANLSSEDISIDDNTLSPTETVTVTAQIKSDGVIDAQTSSAELIIATAPNAAAVTGSLGRVDLVGLATGAQQGVSFDIDASDLEPGTYWVAVRADSDDALNEESETDNLSEWVEITVEAPVSDLKLTSVGIGDRSDLDLEGGGAIEINYSIVDASNVNDGYFNVATYLSTDETVSTDDLRIASITGGTFPGQDIDVSGIRYFQDDYAPGEYYLISVVSWGGGPIDATPEDNVLTQTVTLTGPPETVDVSVLDVTIEPSSDLDLALEGFDTSPLSLDLTFDVANLGTSAAPDTALTAYLSTDGTVSDDDIAFWNGSLNLNAGQNSTISVSADIAADVDIGDYQVIVVANAQDDIDSTNDIATQGVTITGTPPPTVYQGTNGADIWSSGSTPAIVDLLGGDDIALAATGSDIVDGGVGFDTLDFSGATRAVEGFYVSNDTFSVTGSSFNETSSWTNFEKVIGSDFDDQISILEQQPSPAQVSRISELSLGAGNDVALGSSYDDLIDGGTGDDFLIGALGDDVFITGDGFDFVALVRTSDEAGHGHDVVEDFDVEYDLVLLGIENGDVFNPLDNLTQTSEGAVLNYADDSSVLFLNVDASDLTLDQFLLQDASPPVYTTSFG